MRAHQGFSLIEMALVLLVVTLLLGGLLVPLGTQVEQKRIAETQKALEEAKEALLGFAVAHGRLPCPDTFNGAVAPDVSNDGLEDACSAVNETEGNLPWATLGVGATDAWGNHLRYRVTGTFTATGASAFTLSTAGTIKVCVDTVCSATVATAIPAVVMSHGKNGYGAVNANTAPNAATFNALPSSPGDEYTNYFSAIASKTFVSRTLTAPGAGLAEFDDQVVWLSPNILFNRMVAAGRLP